MALLLAEAGDKALFFQLLLPRCISKVITLLTGHDFLWTNLTRWY